MKRCLLAQFEGSGALVAALSALAEEGVQELDAHTPYPVEGVAEALQLPASPVPWLALLGALVGAIAAYLIQWFCAAVDYPLNVGGRPLHSAPAFIPITFESAVLGAALSVFLGLLWLWRFPRLVHPVFEVEGFVETASNDGYWLSLMLDEDAAQLASLTERMRLLGAKRISVVPGAVTP